MRWRGLPPGLAPGRAARGVRGLALPLLVAQGVALAAIALMALGALRSWDMLAHDHALRVWGREAPTPDSPVLLVGAEEADLNRFGWPLPDRTLARTLDVLAAAGPRAIGIDLYRDRPRPPGAEALTAAFERHRTVVVVYKPRLSGAEPGIPPPSVLEGSDRVGFADIVVDPDGSVRRGLLFLTAGQASHVSFPLNLAVRFLAAEGLRLGPDPARRDGLRLGRSALPPLEPDFGAYAGADTAGYQILMDYRDGPAAPPRVSLGDLLDGRVPAERLADRVVIVGVAADSVKDHFFTPLDRDPGGAQPTLGIAVHGHLVSQLIRLGRGQSAPYRALDGPAEAAWIWLWAMLGAGAGLLPRGWARFAALLIGGAAVPWGIGLLASGAFWWLPVAAPVLAWGGAASLVTAWRMQRERADREALMQLFAVNVSPGVADALWRERERFMVHGRPLPQTLTATVLFTDIRGFTTIAETMPADVLLDWLNRYMDTMVDLVSAHGGVVDKFIGDAIMAVFGVPVPRGDHAAVAADAQAAVACARAFAAALEDLNRAFAAEGLPRVAMRVGINTGPVVAGGLGSRARMNYTVLGDTVNVAARLESFDRTLAADRDCRVLIGAETRALLDESVTTRLVGSVALKGKTQDMQVYMIEADGGDPGPVAGRTEAGAAAGDDDGDAPAAAALRNQGTHP